MPDVPVYKADDRSILLPFYKRFLVEPSLRFIPSSVHPNSITHAGHLLCLAAVGLLVALRPTQGWPFVVSSILLQAYIWADNADGAHARRTKQSSAYGEFLDHGLDILNTIYIGIITAFTLGTSPGWTVAMVMMIPAAAGITCWEQTQTGVYRLGLLNQIESCAILSAAMFFTAVLGQQWWHVTGIGPVTLYLVFLVWPASSIVVGYVRAFLRVRAAGKPLAPALVFALLQACVLAAGMLGYLSVLVACSFATAANLYFGIRMLVTRLRGAQPKTDGILVCGTVGLLGFLAYVMAGLPVNRLFGVAIAVAICVVFGILVILDTRNGVQVLERIEARR